MVLFREKQSMEIPSKRMKKYLNAINKIEKILNSYGSYDNLLRQYYIGKKNKFKKDINSF